MFHLLRRFASASFTPTFDADVTAWIAAVVANGGTVSRQRGAQVQVLVNALKLAGSWQLDDDLWMLVAENAPQALTSLKQRRLAVAVASPTFTTDRGYAFNGTTQYLNTNFNPLSHAVAMAAANARIGGYERTNPTASSTFLAGCSTTGPTGQIYLRPRTTGSTCIVAPNTGNTNNYTLPAADSRGYTAGSRNGGTAADCAAYKTGSALVRSADPTSFLTVLPGSALYIGANNASGTAASFRASTIGLVDIGATLTAGQELAHYTAIQAHMTSLGANV